MIVFLYARRGGDLTLTRAFELAANDVIRVGDRIARVVSEPETLHRGLSLFDEFKLLVGLRIQAVDDPLQGDYLVLEPDQLVRVIRDEADAPDVAISTRAV